MSSVSNSGEEKLLRYKPRNWVFDMAKFQLNFSSMNTGKTSLIKYSPQEIPLDCFFLHTKTNEKVVSDFACISLISVGQYQLSIEYVQVL